MAIEDTTNAGKPAGHGRAQQQDTGMTSAFANAQRNAGGQQEQRPGSFSFRNPGALSRHAMGRTQASEALTKLFKAINTLLQEQVNKAFKVTCIPVEKEQTTSLGVSVLIVCMQDTTLPKLGVAYHTLLLEASTDQIPPRFIQINGSSVEVMKVVGDADDEVMNRVVNEYVIREFGNIELNNAGACVVPRDFNVSDEKMIFELAANTAFACSSELEAMRPDFVDMNLANAEKDSCLMTRTTFGNQQSYDAVGCPVRADIVMDFTAGPQNQNQQDNGGQAVDRVNNLARVSGFVDLVWDPQNPQQSQYVQYQQPLANPLQRYSVRTVITELESSMMLTIPAQLLALLPAAALRENNAWAQAFHRSNFPTAGIDMKDIGAIGIEVNPEGDPSGFGDRIDTKKDSFNQASLGRLIAATIRPGMVLSLDVPECGPSTWYNGVFAAAAANKSLANQAIIRAANQLTNNAFGKHFPDNGRIAYDDANRIHLGHYGDGSGVRRDIRDIDYLAILNIVGKQDPVIVRDWSDTFLKVQYPLEQRLAARKKILIGLFSDIVFTGFARRVTFDPLFIEALIAGCRDAGLQVRSMSNYADLGSYERASAGFGTHAMMSADMTGIFNRGNQSTPHGMGARGGYGKWGG